jgi:hypothetical protein
MATKRVSEKKLGVSPGAAPATAKAPSTRKSAPSKRTARPVSPVETPVTEVAAPHEPIAAPAIATQAVAALAYSYWVARGCQGGSPEEDWLRAERELCESLAVVTFSKATA